MAARRTKGFVSRGAAMDVALDLGVQYGRPVVTGIGVAEDERGWYIRVDFHSMEDGDSFLMLRCKEDAEQVKAEVRRINELNAAAFLRERERMQAEAAAAERARAELLEYGLHRLELDDQEHIWDVKDMPAPCDGNGERHEIQEGQPYYYAEDPLGEILTLCEDCYQRAAALQKEHKR